MLPAVRLFALFALPLAAAFARQAILGAVMDASGVAIPGASVVATNVGALSESVEVVGEAPLVDTASATQGSVVGERVLEDLPADGRNAFSLMMLSSAVQSTNGPVNSGFVDRGTGLSQVSINGGPSSLNSISLDAATKTTATTKT